MKILFVEDDENISSLAKDIFIKTEHDVIMSPSPRLAIIALNSDVFDLVVLDMVFPEGNGVDVINHISTKRIKPVVIIYSGNTEKFKFSVDKHKKSGLVKFVWKKPMKFSEMLSVIDSIK